MVADAGISEQVFLELRRKVRGSELLSASVEKLLFNLQFNGRLSVVIQNGRIVRSGYEEGYFRSQNAIPGRESTPSPVV